MIINVKGIGKVDFPDSMSLEDINKVLSDMFSKEKAPTKEEISLMVKSLIGEMVKPEPPVIPDIEIAAPEPVDMQPIADALRAILSKPSPDIKIDIPKRASGMEIEITERDTFGNIKRLRMTEVA